MKPSRLQSVSILIVALLALPAFAQVINEGVVGHSGVDNHEFLEVFGAPNTDYSNLTLVSLEGNGSENPGNVDWVQSVGTTNGNGYWDTGFMTDQLENNSLTLFLVDGFSGAVNDDLDTDDDGILDTSPWTSVLDSLSIDAEDVNDRSYSSVVLGVNYDGLDPSFEPEGFSRIPDGVDSDEIHNFQRNDRQGYGEWAPADDQLGYYEASNTPGAKNYPDQPAVLSEFVTDYTAGGSNREFIEVFGSAFTLYGQLDILVVDGDGGGNPGQILNVLPVPRTNEFGMAAIEQGAGADDFPNGSMTLLLVDSFSGVVLDDLDTNDDGVIDVNPWASITDAISVHSGVGGDFTYAGTAQLVGGYDGQPAVPGGASRFPLDGDTDLPADWVRNSPDWMGATPGRAANTPAEMNFLVVDDYYKAVDDTNAVTLRASLHEVIDNHMGFPYSGESTDTWNIINMADEDPNNSANVLTIYKNASYTKISGGTGAYNREHSWPNSWGIPDRGATNIAYSDCFHLFASDTFYNGDRSRAPFGTCHAGCNENTTDVNDGQGGGSGSYPGNSNWYTGDMASNSGIWETWDYRKGDLARAMFYMDLRYEGGSHDLTALAEPDLRLTDNTALIVSTGINEPIAYMGRLATLLAWHQADPPNAREIARNLAVYMHQGSRNPFIDHPEYVACIYLDDCASLEIFSDGFESGDTTAWSSTTP